MWLLDVETLELKEFIGEQIPAYATLSHTWGSEEVSFVEMKKPKCRESARQMAGFSKIEGCCAQAKKDGFAWVWVDTCCIDKRSSAELSEAINSMFRWYELSDRCYVYLSDVLSGSEAIPMLSKSKWFTRGWTLQELLAPRKVVFFAQDWVPIGHKTTTREEENQTVSSGGETDADKILPCANLAEEISTITNIPADFLVGEKILAQACVSQRMFWASRRETSRAEDRAYSLMGLFGINMPILYGEGLEKAFTRLQREIMSETTDQSILAWYHSNTPSYRLLAESPDCFQNSGTVTPMTRANWSSSAWTNLGLRIALPMTTMDIHVKNGGTYRFGDTTEALLDCVAADDDGNRRRISLNLLFLRKNLEGHLVFLCCRPQKWNFNAAMGHPMSINLCGYDSIGDRIEEVEKFVTSVFAHQSKNNLM